MIGSLLKNIKSAISILFMFALGIGLVQYMDWEEVPAVEFVRKIPDKTAEFFSKKEKTLDQKTSDYFSKSTRWAKDMVVSATLYVADKVFGILLPGLMISAAVYFGWAHIGKLVPGLSKIVKHDK